jgi:hypothetical protein
MLAACGNDRDSAAHDTADGAEAGQVVDDGQSATGPELEPTQGVGEPSTGQAEENSTPEAGADSATGGQVVEQGEDPDDDGDGAASDAAALIGALNIPLPEGATIVSADDVDDDDGPEVTYEVANMSSEQVLTFFRDNLSGAGYEIQGEDDDSIEFAGKDRTGTIEVEGGEGGSTRFELDID